MRRENVQWFRCLSCDASGWNVHAEQVADDDIVEGTLECARCGASYPIHHRTPRFVVSEGYSKTFGYQWNVYRKTQLDSYTGVPVSRERVLEATGWPPNLAGQRILEAGSGAGRFTEVLLSCGAEVFSFDYSSAVDANMDNNGANRRLCLFQANIFDIPVPRASFDKVFCFGVLQHTPDPERALKSLAQYVKPGGEIAVDCYKKTLVSLIQWKYLLRPITRRMDPQKLHKIVTSFVVRFLPLATWLRRIGGRFAVRLVPIAEYSNLGLPDSVSREWAILDTFDMYSPEHDHPQTSATLRRWLQEAKLNEVSVRPGSNGFILRGRRNEAS